MAGRPRLPRVTWVSVRRPVCCDSNIPQLGFVVGKFAGASPAGGPCDTFVSGYLTSFILMQSDKPRLPHLFVTTMQRVLRPLRFST